MKLLVCKGYSYCQNSHITRAVRITLHILSSFLDMCPLIEPFIEHSNNAIHQIFQPGKNRSSGTLHRVCDNIHGWVVHVNAKKKVDKIFLPTIDNQSNYYYLVSLSRGYSFYEKPLTTPWYDGRFSHKAQHEKHSPLWQNVWSQSSVLKPITYKSY